MKRTPALVGLALAAATPFLSSLPAGASVAPSAEVGRLNPVVVVDSHDPDVVRVTAKYRCTSDAPSHLWVSVKQGGPDPTAEGSSSTVDAWYDDHPQDVTCDGTWQNQTFDLPSHVAQGWEGRETWSRLENGTAWLQFCLFPSEEDFSVMASVSQWVQVRGA